MRLTKEMIKKLKKANSECPLLGEKTVQINKTISVTFKVVGMLSGETEITIFKNGRYIGYFGCFSFTGCINKLKAYKVGKGLPPRSHWD